MVSIVWREEVNGEHCVEGDGEHCVEGGGR